MQENQETNKNKKFKVDNIYRGCKKDKIQKRESKMQKGAAKRIKIQQREKGLKCSKVNNTSSELETGMFFSIGQEVEQVDIITCI